LRAARTLLYLQWAGVGASILRQVAQAHEAKAGAPAAVLVVETVRPGDAIALMA
jgi:hypothetical protein